MTEHELKFLAGALEAERRRLAKLRSAEHLATTLRRRLILPHRALDSLAGFVRELEDFMGAVGVLVDDVRWVEASRALAAARTWIRSACDHRAREDARRHLPTSVPGGSELGASGRRDELVDSAATMDVVEDFHRRRNQRVTRPPAGVSSDARGRAKRRL